METNLMNAERIRVQFETTQYDILIAKSIINTIASTLNQYTNNKKIIIVADNFFQDSYVKQISKLLTKENYEIHTYLMDAGKGNKNIHEALKIYSILEENNFSRDSTLIALGGGVIGDLAGFVASTWLRGMNLVHIPTTLMAMVDSSIGGKVAVNFGQTINGIGNYYHPIFTLLDLTFLESLPQRDYKSGLAEVIKCAIISDKKFYHYLEKHVQQVLNRESEFLLHSLIKSIKIKIDHVKNDVRESNKRLLLNYGHTLGHAIEISTQKNHQEQYRHGEGVSIGIMSVAYIASKHLNLPEDIYNSFKNIFESYGLPTFVNSQSLGFTKEHLFTQCIKNVNKDKKKINNKLRLILTKEIGKASIHADVPIDLVEEAFDYIIR